MKPLHLWIDTAATGYEIQIRIPDHLRFVLQAKLHQMHRCREMHHFDDKQGQRLRGSGRLGVGGSMRCQSAIYTVVQKKRANFGGL